MILIRKGLKYKMLRKAVFAKSMLIAIHIGGATLGAIYSLPSASWAGLKACLETFQSLSQGKALLVGDFNARHQNWCTRNNPRGRKLSDWALLRRWSIVAPAQSTFRSSSGATSVIDLALVKSGTTRRINARLE